MPLILRDIVKEYDTASGPLCILHGVSLELDDQASLAILGPSGSGKSTLLNIVGTLERATSGQILLDGEDPGELGPSALARFRSQRIGFVFQEHHLLPQCTVLENVLVPTLARTRTAPEALDRAILLLDRVGLHGRLQHRPGELSGGERQRVAFARALINQPRLLLADEPTGNLDRGTADEVTRLMLELQQWEPLILLIVTHSIHLAEQMQRRMVLNEGRLQDAAELGLPGV